MYVGPRRCVCFVCAPFDNECRRTTVCRFILSPCNTLHFTHCFCFFLRSALQHLRSNVWGSTSGEWKRTRWRRNRTKWKKKKKNRRFFCSLISNITDLSLSMFNRFDSITHSLLRGCALHRTYHHVCESNIVKIRLQSVVVWRSMKTAFFSSLATKCVRCFEFIFFSLLFICSIRLLWSSAFYYVSCHKSDEATRNGTEIKCRTEYKHIKLVVILYVDRGSPNNFEWASWLPDKESTPKIGKISRCRPFLSSLSSVCPTAK